MNSRTNTALKKIIKKAAALIVERGFYPEVKGQSLCCALAIERAGDDGEKSRAARDFFASKIGLKNGDCTVIGEWNDKVGKKAVLAAMRKVAR